METLQTIVERLETIAGDILARIGTIVAFVLLQIDASANPALVRAAAVVVLFGLGIAFWAHSLYRFRHTDEDPEDYDLPAGFFFARMCMRAFYPLLVIHLFMTAVKGHQVLELVPMRFDNYGAWYGPNQFFAGLVLFEFLFSSALCLLRLKPLRLIGYWVHTIDYALIGLFLGNLYLLLVQLFGRNLLGGLLVFFLGIVLDSIIPFLFVGTSVAPIYAYLVGIGATIVRFFQSFTFQVESKDGRTYEGNSLFFIMDMLLP